MFSLRSSRGGGRRIPGLGLPCGVVLLALSPSPATSTDFTHFESSHVHPIALDETGSRLFAVNTPEARLAIFEVRRDGGLAFSRDVPVGLEPVSLAVRPGAAEVWVANHLSDSVSVVDAYTGRLVDTLPVGDEPTDVAFAGNRAFVTLAGREDRVVVYDAGTREPIAAIPLFGDDPRALAVAPDADRVAAIVLESGNRTAGLRRDLVSEGGGPPSPDPPADPALPSPPDTSLILEFQPEEQRWVDERGGDWTAFMDFQLLDWDVFTIDANASVPQVTGTATGVGTTLFDIAFHPETGEAWVLNTDARNLVRFEPNLRGHLVRTQVTVVAVSGDVSRTIDLNPHIDYARTPGPPGEIARSLALPVAGVFSGDGSRLYVAAFGSARVGVLDTESGRVTRRIRVGGGPSGLALHERAGRLYVMSRFDNAISIVDVERGIRIGSVGVAGPASLDPTPPEVVRGRALLYDGARSSGHGDIACATCHLFANFDGLAWDLGDPSGAVVRYSDAPWVDLSASPREGWHPMKGPMVTQTLRGLRGREPFHWRGDRRNFQHFNGAFVSLLGRDRPLPEADMDAFADFIMTVEPPPNPFRGPDDSLPAIVPGHGDPAVGAHIFANVPVQGGQATCTSCHDRNDGAGRIFPPFAGPQDVQIPPLWNVYEKLGLDRSSVPGGGTARKSGFGIFHHGNFSLEFFLDSGSPGLGDNRPDMSAFLLSFPSGTFPCVGWQRTFQGGAGGDAASLFRVVSAVARQQCDLVAKGSVDHRDVGFLLDPTTVQLVPDTAAGARVFPPALLAGLGEDDVVTFTAVPRGNGRRLGIDRDRDGCLDGDELRVGTNPARPGEALPDEDEDGIPDASDRCPGWAQRDRSQRDRNRDGVPDECQCGDLSDDGRLGFADVVHLLRLLFERPLPRTAVHKCNVHGSPGAAPELCDWDDLRELYRAVAPRRGRWRRGRPGPDPLPALCFPPFEAPDPVPLACADPPVTSRSPEAEEDDALRRDG